MEPSSGSGWVQSGRYFISCVFHFKPLLSDFSGLLFSGNSQQWDHYDFLTEISNNAGMLAILQKVLHGYYIIVYTYCKNVILIVIL